MNGHALQIHILHNTAHIGNEERRFDIIEETGVLFTSATLDREIRSSYLLSIQTRDSATANRLSSVTQVIRKISVHT